MNVVSHKCSTPLASTYLGLIFWFRVYSLLSLPGGLIPYEDFPSCGMTSFIFSRFWIKLEFQLQTVTDNSLEALYFCCLDWDSKLCHAMSEFCVCVCVCVYMYINTDILAGIFKSESGVLAVSFTLHSSLGMNEIEQLNFIFGNTEIMKVGWGNRWIRSCFGKEEITFNRDLERRKLHSLPFGQCLRTFLFSCLFHALSSVGRLLSDCHKAARDMHRFSFWGKYFAWHGQLRISAGHF